MKKIEEIKADLGQARKDRDSFKLSVLTTFYSEAAMVGKDAGNRDSTDTEVVEKGRRFIKKIDETITILEGRNDSGSSSTIADFETEKEILNKYLPQLLSVAELGEEIKKIIDSEQLNSPKQMGMIMKKLGERFTGLYDGKVASTIARELLSS